MKRLIVLFCAGLMIAVSHAAPVMPGDSIGSKLVNGKRYVLYKIAPGDNLSSVARQYQSSVKGLIELNEMPDAGLKVGQVILIPGRGGKNLAATEKPKVAPKKHTVQAGESLYAISRIYNVKIEDIQKWNGMAGTGLDVGQVLFMGPGQNEQSNSGNSTADVKPKQNDRETPGPKIKQRPGLHVVLQGETLYGIARQYGMDARDVKKLNNLRSNEIKEGQALRVRAEMSGQANPGKPLINALEEGTAETPPAVKEEFPDLEVLTVRKNNVVIAPDANVELYTDKFTKKQYKRVEEKGTFGPIEDFNTDQTKFYAFHKFVPAGSYLRVDNPAKGQSILVEVVNSLPDSDPYSIRLSAKCMEYLMVRKPGADVVIRYVIPVNK